MITKHTKHFNLISTVGTTEIKASLKKTTLVDLMKEEAPSEKGGVVHNCLIYDNRFKRV